MAENFEGLNFAADTAKQIINLSTGVLALTVTFLEKLVKKDAIGQIPIPATLKYAWIFYGFALFFGLWTLMSIAGVANRSAKCSLFPDAMEKSIVLPAMAMVIMFLAGIIFTICTGFQLFN